MKKLFSASIFSASLLLSFSAMADQNCSSQKDYDFGVKNGLKMAPPCKEAQSQNKPMGQGRLRFDIFTNGDPQKEAECYAFRMALANHAKGQYAAEYAKNPNFIKAYGLYSPLGDQLENYQKQCENSPNGEKCLANKFGDERVVSFLARFLGTYPKISNGLQSGNVKNADMEHYLGANCSKL